jgi:hypothetical protein
MAWLKYPTATLLAGLLVWALFLASFITTKDNPNIQSAAYISPSPLSTIMAIKTRNTSIKEKPTKAGSASVIHPARRIKHSTSRSPKENRVNSLLTDINQPQNQFEGALVILGTLDDENENLDDPCDLVPPITPAKNIGTGVTVRINDSPPQVYAPDPVVHAHVSDTPRSILRKSIKGSNNQLNESTSDDTSFSTNLSEEGDTDKVIHNKSGKLLREIGAGHKIEYIVHDFAGLYPVWPIIEFSLAPAGATKDERMSQFVRCVAALLGEILLVNEKAAIAPIEITNNKKEDMLSNKTDIPDNYTKLGKWLLLSGSSWVFNKANSDVYGRFRIKSTVPVVEMLTRVFFEFSRLGRSKVYKKQNQAMETETPMMLLFVSNETDAA